MTLDALVREYLLENGKTENEYFKHLQLSISGLREFNMDLSGVPITVILPVNANLTVDLPEGYINYIRIAVADRLGNLHSLGLNDKMSFIRSFDKCGNLQPTNNQATASTANGNFIGTFEGFADNWRNGELMGRFFGIGGGNNANGYYRIDQQHGVIQLQCNHASTIVLEYLSDLSLVNGHFQVHPFIIYAIKRWIGWQALLNNSRAALGAVQQAERYYNLAYRNAIKRFTSGTLEEWYAVFRSGNSAAVKF